MTDIAATSPVPGTPLGAGIDHRTRRLLEAPILPLLIRLAWPNVLIMLAQASAGLIETWWVAKLGTDALAGMALVFPAVMLMTTISAGAIGGGISSAVARALGAGRREAADALVLHAVAVNLLIGLGFSALFLLFGRRIYGFLGGSGGELEAALIYSNVVFAGNVLTWLMNGLASVVRGTGNMLFPAVVTCVGVVLLIPVSPLLIFGVGPLPGFGIAGGGMALVAYYAAGAIAMAWYILSGRSPVRLSWVRLRWAPLASILRVGALSALQSIQTNVIIAGTTALVAAHAGVNAVAGFGTAVRLEYLLIPLIFGIGAPMVAMVGTNIGAGRGDRALKIAMAGAGLAFGVTELIGLAAALFPQAWLGLFSAEPAMIETGSAYLRIVAPFYGFFGVGLSLYFAAQGAGRLFWPLIGGFVRVVIALGGGWIALRFSGSLSGLFAALAVAVVAYGVTVFAAVRSGLWLR
ncbi:MATE family efflux transporter [Ancylobacter sp. Lp-2]|uniref:MATE family efflux transporter n=1 Tax=Ancylobacter sp. Lp-2 TaxID=2881339 RepID=UPI001E2E3AA7|nr:MATE family efflux transporter [Ancylobacter sp. Lp-2]MCB4767860.1 MATE family efflux transporter [Ancylobacter sp. Lp-2]